MVDSQHIGCTLNDGRVYARDIATGQIHGLVDWRWRSAQPRDVWQPKPRKAGKLVNYYNALGRQCIMDECNAVTVEQHHAADKSVVIRTAAGHRTIMKWKSLKQHWSPSVVRTLLEEEIKNG